MQPAGPAGEASASRSIAAATWSYDLQPNDDGGTVVTETRVLKNHRATIASVVTANLMLGGLASHEAEILAGMRATLERIKAEVEGR